VQAKSCPLKKERTKLLNYYNKNTLRYCDKVELRRQRGKQECRLEKRKKEQVKRRRKKREEKEKRKRKREKGKKEKRKTYFSTI